MLPNLVKDVIRACLPSRWVLYRAPRAGDRVALTFDDGPNPDYTARVSALLKQAGARATFFLVGEHVHRHPQLVAQLRADGHELGNHSMTHAEFDRMPLPKLAQEIDAPYRLQDDRGAPVLSNRYFRPPKGVLNARVLYYCVRHGYRIVMWSADPKDFRAPSAEAVLRYFDTHPLNGGDIVLLHDKTDATLAALPGLLATLRARGLAPVTLSELLQRRAA